MPTPEETAVGRLAGELWRLASGLADLGIPLDETVDFGEAPVTTALAALKSAAVGKGVVTEHSRPTTRALDELIEEESARNPEFAQGVADTERRLAVEQTVGTADTRQEGLINVEE
jgi:hypothetical protein